MYRNMYLRDHHNNISHNISMALTSISILQRAYYSQALTTAFCTRRGGLRRARRGWRRRGGGGCLRLAATRSVALAVRGGLWRAAAYARPHTLPAAAPL